MRERTETGKRRTGRRRAAYAGRVAGASGRVLVVDDSAVIRQLITVNLELEGFEVLTATDGVACLDLAHRVRPDVITLDIVMPHLDGLRTAERLYADPRTRHVPVAVVSARTQLGPARGVDAFLRKPFDPADLVHLVRRLARPGVRGRRGAWPSGSSGPPGSSPSVAGNAERVARRP
ncbi:response regulator [Streptomyces sp. JJ66]|uniref:response regulator n=1 Tax=Streptomyces sp. JJ66 TaxID=2803843 RepID=UPI001C594EAE|nr:response regulator [Streptomyces sp. JJ66]MBW1601447.1 response regulator [Streptomyces sp. JJ66]